MTFKPLLASPTTDDDLRKLKFPVLWSPKLDGIRTVIHPTLGPVTRKLKMVPNEALREFLSNPLLSGFDGEMVYGDVTDKDVFNTTQRAVMTVAGPGPEGRATYLVFDDVTDPEMPFQARFAHVAERILKLPPELAAVVKLVPHQMVETYDDLMNIERIVVEQGYEGVMIRSTIGPYKYGRSTLKEQTLLKIKRFSDEEAQIVGIEELYHNNNEKLRDELGHAKRSTHQENLSPAGTMGAFVVKSDKFDQQFKIGTGFTAEQRSEIWENRDKLVGKTISFKYQPSGMKDLPRFPVFKGFRGD